MKTGNSGFDYFLMVSNVCFTLFKKKGFEFLPR